MILASGPESQVTLTEPLYEATIDSLFQKKNKLRTLPEWDETTFEEQLGNKTDWAIVTGQSLSGKSLVSTMIAGLTNGKVIDLAKLAEDIRPRLETEDGPFEGPIPEAEVEKDILKLVNEDKARGDKFLYLLDGRHHDSVEKAMRFYSANMGAPCYIISCQAEQKEIERRFREKNEMGDEIGEEDQARIKEEAAAADAERQAYVDDVREFGDKVVQVALDTAVSKESLAAQLRSNFCARIILVNHEKRLNVDTACANLAIKYNLLYLSVYQLIKNEITRKTEIGRKLELTRIPKALDLGHGEDEFEEGDFSAAHFDSDLVMQLVRSKIGEQRTNQRFILLEGLCNANKLQNASEKLQLRFMDEYFQIEKSLGEVFGVISLQETEEDSHFTVEAGNFEEPVEEEVKEEAPKAEGEGEDEPAADGDEEVKKPAWDAKKFRWSITNGRSKNLP